MLNQSAFQRLLQLRFEEARNKNASYSLRAFAARLEIDPGPLSQILKGKRRVSQKLADRMLDRLQVDLTARSQLLIKKQVLHQEITEEDSMLLKEDQFKLIGDWYHYAILSLMQMKDFKNHSMWIARRLNLSENQVRDAIARMKRLELLEESTAGRLRRRQPRLKTSDNIASESLKKSHTQTLALATQSLEKHSIEFRDFTHLTVPTNLAQIQKAKVYLRKVQDELCDLLMDTTEKTEVYRLSIGLFPLTEIESEKLK